MKNITPIDNLVDIDSIPSEILPPYSNPNFNDQIDTENINRGQQSNTLRSRIRQDSSNWRTAMNGGGSNEYRGDWIEPSGEYDFLPKNSRASHFQGPPQIQLNCMDIAEHVQNCPICTRFYAPEDKTNLYLIIIVLSVICFLLFKKILDEK